MKKTPDNNSQASFLKEHLDMAILIAFLLPRGREYFGGAYRRISAGNTERRQECSRNSPAVSFIRSNKRSPIPKTIGPALTRGEG